MIFLGCLKSANLSLQKFFISFSVIFSFDLILIKAQIFSPNNLSGIPITAHSSISGCLNKIFSISLG